MSRPWYLLRNISHDPYHQGPYYITWKKETYSWKLNREGSFCKLQRKWKKRRVRCAPVPLEVRLSQSCRHSLEGRRNWWSTRFNTGAMLRNSFRDLPLPLQLVWTKQHSLPGGRGLVKISFAQKNAAITLLACRVWNLPSTLSVSPAVGKRWQALLKYS